MVLKILRIFLHALYCCDPVEILHVQMCAIENQSQDVLQNAVISPSLASLQLNACNCILVKSFEAAILSGFLHVLHCYDPVMIVHVLICLSGKSI